MALLLTLAEAGGPRVALVQGAAGMGKTSLLAELRTQLASRGVTSHLLRGGAIEPSPSGFLTALGEALSAPDLSLSDLSSWLEPKDGERAVLLLDEAECLHLLSTWLRRDFAPRLPASVALLLAGRGEALAAWERERPGEVVRLTLGPLRRGAVDEIARTHPLRADPEELWRRSAGHPLALSLLLRTPGPVRDASPAGLAREILRAADDPALERAVEAASVLRRLTRPLLAAMEPDLDAGAALAALEALPFVLRDEEGLRLAEPVRAAEAARLAALEPERHAQLRSRAAVALAAALAASSARERWRFAADLLFLVPRPEVRAAFFPSETPLPAVDLAGPQDAPALDDMAALRGAELARVARLWREALPHRVWVARDGAGRPLAFYVLARSEDDLDALAKADPLLAAWRAHHGASGSGRSALFLRVLAQAGSPGGEAGRAACTLDAKRAYIERRDLGAVYATADAGALADPALRELGFRPLALAGHAPDTMLLDLGARGFDGWIARLAGVEEDRGGVEAPTDLALDRLTRELRAAGHSATLTRLEAELLAALLDAAPAPVGREALIETVWRRTVVGSNVVDATVRTLRAKLGPHRDRVQTVAGFGYRLTPKS